MCDSFFYAQHLVSLTGKVDIRLNIDIPEDTEFVEPLHESCVWCQARGAATEALVVKGVTGSSDKVSNFQFTLFPIACSVITDNELNF